MSAERALSFGAIFFFSSYEFSYEKCSEIFPEVLGPLFCWSENSCRIPFESPQKEFPAKDHKESPTSFCRSGEHFLDGALQQNIYKHFLVLAANFRNARLFIILFVRHPGRFCSQFWLIVRNFV